MKTDPNHARRHLIFYRLPILVLPSKPKLSKVVLLELLNFTQIDGDAIAGYTKVGIQCRA